MFSAVIVSSLFLATALAAKPEQPNPLEAIWAAITGLQTQIDTKAASEPDYDSGWIDITSQAGQQIIVTHNLNTTDTRVYITGKTTEDGGTHQRYLGLVNPIETHDKTSNERVYEEGASMTKTSDGGYALSGFGSGGMLLMKIDSFGAVQWSKSYGNNFVGEYVIQTSDGGYALLFKSYNATHNNDINLMKTNQYGVEEFHLSYEKSPGSIDWPFSIVQTNDGGFMILGRTNGVGTAGGLDFWLIKTDANGAVEWDRTYGEASSESPKQLIQTKDGGYLLIGTSYSGPNIDIWMVKIDSSGNAQWTQRYDQTVIDQFYDVVQTEDHGYAILASKGSQTSRVAWLIKTDGAGAITWDQTYDTWNGKDLVQTSDGGYAIAATQVFGTYEETRAVWLTKTDESGTQIWDKAYNGSFAEALDVFETIDGGYVVGANKDRHVWFISFDPNGESGLAWVDTTDSAITMYRGFEDKYWNYVRVQIWKLD